MGGIFKIRMIPLIFLVQGMLVDRNFYVSDRGVLLDNVIVLCAEKISLQ